MKFETLNLEKAEEIEKLKGSKIKSIEFTIENDIITAISLDIKGIGILKLGKHEYSVRALIEQRPVKYFLRIKPNSTEDYDTFIKEFKSESDREDYIIKHKADKLIYRYWKYQSDYKKEEYCLGTSTDSDTF